MKKIISALLSFFTVMLLCIPAIPVASAEDTETDYSDYIHVTEYSQLATGSQLNNQKYVLDNDIDCSGSTSLINIGTNVTIDGNGHSFSGWNGMNMFALYNTAITICNVTFGSAEQPFSFTAKGLFLDDTYANVTWENVTLYASFGGTGAFGSFSEHIDGKHLFRNCTVTCNISNAASNTGGWIGYTSDNGAKSPAAVFENCMVYGSISNTGNRTAGFVANVIKGTEVTFRNCVNEASVSGSSNCGGFVGNSGTDTTAPISLTDCVNRGSVTGTGDNVAGFIGYQYIVSTFKSCENQGDIIGSASNVGGFIGVQNKDSSWTGCVNRGAVSGSTQAGGFVGLVGKVSASGMTDCANYGSVKTTGNKAGGLIGQINVDNATPEGFVMDGCLNKGTITSGSNAAGFVAEGNGAFIIRNSVNLGEIKGTAWGSIGGFVGYGDYDGWSVIGSANLGKITSSADARIAGVVGGGNCGTLEQVYLFGTVEPKSNGNSGVVTGQGAPKSASGVYYIPISSEYTLVTSGLENAVSCTHEEALEITKAQKNIFVYEYFLENGNWIIATPRLTGVQNTVPDSNDQQKVRFLAVLDSVSYDQIGFEFRRVAGENALPDKIDKEYCTVVFQNILSNDSGKEVRYSAASMNGNYIYTLTFTGVPTNQGNVTFEIRPFAETADGTVYFGDTYTVIYQNGSFVSSQLNTIE